jgi:hypothetical protein
LIIGTSLAALANLRLISFTPRGVDPHSPPEAARLGVRAVARKASVIWLGTAVILLLSSWPATITYLLAVAAANAGWDLVRCRAARPPFTEWGPGQLLEEDRPALVRQTLTVFLAVLGFTAASAVLLGL